MAMRLEVRVADQVGDVVLAPGEVVVDAQHIMALGQQPLAQMRAEESGAACHQDTRTGQGHSASLLGNADS
jgi:hypothetical protein